MFKSKSEYLLPIIFIFLLTFWIFYCLFFKVNYWESHDGEFHILRGYAATKSLAEGQFPLRWSSLLNYNCGAPIYNFFYPLIYYIIGILGFFKISPIFSFKLILFFSIFIGSTYFYFFIYRLSKSKLSALTGTVLFAVNPYFLSLIYVRSNPEIVSFCLLPVIFYYLLTKKYLPLFIFFFLYLVSHNLTVMITLPLIFILIFYLFFKNKNIDYFLIFTLVFGFISATFFIGPAILEKQYIKLGNQIAANYQDHFPTLKQLVFSPWGWGYSQTGDNDGMSFKFGYIQWIVLLASVLIAITNRKLFIFIIPILFILFLDLKYSDFIWKLFPLLQQLQYPWRLLGLAVFLCSFLSAYLIYSTPKSIQFYLFFILLVGSIITNRNHIKAFPKSILPDFNYIGTTTIADEILPQNAVKTCQNEYLNPTYFPDSYLIYKDNNFYKYNNCNGYVCLENGDSLSIGYNWKYKSTGIQKIFNIISIISILFWLLLFIIFQNKRTKVN